VLLTHSGLEIESLKPPFLGSSISRLPGARVRMNKAATAGGEDSKFLARVQPTRNSRVV